MQSFSDNLRRAQSVADFVSANTLPGEFKICCQAGDFGDWLLCDGRAFPKATFPQLAAAVAGTTYEDGDDIRLPDTRSKALCGTGSHANIGVTSPVGTVGTALLKMHLGNVFVYAGARVATAP